MYGAPVGQAIGAVLPLAVAIAIFPVPVIASVLLVGADRGLAKASAFVAAWFLGLLVVGVVVLVVAGAADADDGREPAIWVSLLLLGLGLVCLWAAATGWRGRPREGEEAPTPGWMRAIDGFTVVRSAGAGVAFSALNPKNVLLAAAAAAEIADVGLGRSSELAALVVFALLASVGVAAPVVLALLLGDRSRDVLEWLRGFMGRNSAVIMSVLLVVIGAKLIGDAVSGLSA
jgi:threonine/homoserine/homoserine lactone efflux protein